MLEINKRLSKWVLLWRLEQEKRIILWHFKQSIRKVENWRSLRMLIWVQIHFQKTSRILAKLKQRKEPLQEQNKRLLEHEQSILWTNLLCVMNHQPPKWEKLQLNFKITHHQLPACNQKDLQSNETRPWAMEELLWLMTIDRKALTIEKLSPEMILKSWGKLR